MKSSLKTIRILFGLFLGIVFIFIGNALVVSSAGIILKQMNVDEGMIGLISSFFFLGAICCTIFTTRIVSSLGHIRSYSLFTSLFAIMAIMHDFFDNLIYWASLRFMLGFCYYSLVVIVESWINAKTINEIRSRILAFYEIIYFSSFALGTLILSLNLDSSKIFTLSAFFIILGAVPMIIIRVNEPPLPAKERISIPNIFKVIPLATITAFIAGVLINGFLSMSSVYILSEGFEVQNVAVFMGVAMAGGFCSHLIFGGFSDKFGRKIAIMFACSIGILMCYVFLKFSNNFTLMKILVFFLGIGIFPMYSLALARANDVLQNKSEVIKVGAALLLSYSIGSFISPLIIGVMMQKFGADGFIYTFLIALVFLFIFAAFQKSVPKDKRSRYAKRHTIS